MSVVTVTNDQLFTYLRELNGRTLQFHFLGGRTFFHVNSFQSGSL